MATNSTEDPWAHDRARDLAAPRLSSPTAGIRTGFQHESEHTSRAVEWAGFDALRRRLAESSAASPASWPTEADLYDVDGLPR